MQTVTLGPFLLSVGVVALLLGVIAAQTTAGFLARRGHGDVDAPLWLLLGAGVVAARLSYVLRFRANYLPRPLDIINIRDGGFDLAAGLVVLVLAVGVLAWRRRAWRVGLPVAVAVGLAVWGLVLGAALRLEEATRVPMPELVVRELGGDAVALATFRGQPVVLNLWATWCGPCRREMPMLVTAQAELPGVHFVFADQGEGADSVRGFLAETGLAPRNVLLDAGSELSRHYQAPGYPVTLFLDADGRMRDRHIGELTRAMLQNKLQRLSAPAPREGENS